MSDETLIQNPDTKLILDAIAELSAKVDRLEKRIDSHDMQFEAIRSGLVANSASFDRLQAKF